MKWIRSLEWLVYINTSLSSWNGSVFRFMARCSYPTRTPINPVSAKALSGMHSSDYLQTVGCALLPLQIVTIFSHKFVISMTYSYTSIF